MRAKQLGRTARNAIKQNTRRRTDAGVYWEKKKGVPKERISGVGGRRSCFGGKGKRPFEQTDSAPAGRANVNTVSPTLQKWKLRGTIVYPKSDLFYIKKRMGRIRLFGKKHHPYIKDPLAS